jgi:hypothetical protein
MVVATLAHDDCRSLIAKAVAITKVCEARPFSGPSG